MKVKMVKTLKTDEQIKAFMHPIRNKILGLISKKPMTITQIAHKFEVHPANLTHHFKKLEKAGLIIIHEKRDIGRVVENYYTAVAINFEINQEVNGANAKVLNFLKNDLSANISQLKIDDSEPLIGLIKKAKINEKVYHQFSQKLILLINEFSKYSKNTDGENYALNVSLYPHNVDYGPLTKIRYKKRGTKNE